MTYMLHSVFVNEVMLGFLTSLPCFAAANEINIFFSPFFSLFFFTSSSSPYLRVGRDIVGDYRPQCGKHEANFRCRWKKIKKRKREEGGERRGRREKGRKREEKKKKKKQLKKKRFYL